MKENEFAPVATVPSQAMIEVEQHRAMAEVQSAIVLAKRFPRNQKECQERILLACQRPGLAEQSLYTYSRGGTEITGPSIRLAECLAQNWANLQFGIRELEQRTGESTVEAFCWDMEANVRQVKIFQVKHQRYTKKGTYSLEDPRDIYEMTANQGARRLRACILGIIPGDLVESAVAECEKTLKARADTSPEALKKLLDAFAGFGITKEQIEKRIQRRLDSMTAAQLIQLRKIFNSLKDGMSVPGDWFEIVQPAASGDLKERIKAKRAKEAPEAKQEDSVQTTEATADTKTTEVDFSPNECPDSPGSYMTAKHCQTCKKRLGCPAWS